MSKNRITLQDIKRLCNAESYERAEQYLLIGRVKKVEYYSNILMAKVIGTCVYDVTVNLENGIKATCTCPYDWGGYCKHIVATLLYFSEHCDEIEEKTEQTEGRVSEVLSRISKEELNGFLLQAFKGDSLLRTRFLILFADMEKEKSIDEYREAVELLFLETAENEVYEDYDSIVDFSPLRDLARRYVAKGNFMEGAKIYRAIADGIAEKISEFDNLGLFYEGDFSTVIQDYAACIDSAGLDFPDKKEHIDYLFDQYTAKEPVSFREYYEVALFLLCISEQGFSYVLQLLDQHIPSVIAELGEYWRRSFQVQNSIALKLRILEELKNKEKIFKTLAQYWELSCQYCLAYVKLLKKRGKTDEAVRIAEQGLQRFPAHLTPDLFTFLNRYYQEHDPLKYKHNLIHLFYLTGSWKYYDALKNLLSECEWHDAFQEMSAHLAEKDHFLNSRIIDMYLREKLHGKALELVLKAEDLDLMTAYHRKLSDKYPEQYSFAYQNLIGEFVEKHRGRPHYRRVATFLKKMRGIRGMEKNYDAFIILLRKKYRTRRAFIDEIQRL